MRKTIKTVRTVFNLAIAGFVAWVIGQWAVKEPGFWREAWDFFKPVVAFTIVALVLQTTFRIVWGRLRGPVATPAPPRLEREVQAPDGVRVQRTKLRTPLYPFTARCHAQCGWVHVEIDLDPAGAYVRHRILADAPAKIFRRSLADALKHTTYEVVDASGPMPKKVQTLYTFVIPDPRGRLPDWAHKHQPIVLSA